jgi:RHS repeat-associated protein
VTSFGATTFKYDAAHNRVIRARGAAKTVYVGGVYEQRSTLRLVDHVFYVPLAGRMVAQVVWSMGAGVLKSRNVIYLHDDSLGSVESITGASTPTEHFKYDPFGQRMDPVTLGTPPASASGVHEGFTGQEHEDDPSGLINMRGRLYDPMIGRFLSTDPLVANPGSSQGYNRYSYVYNDPLNFVDPTGFLGDGSEHHGEDCSYSNGITPGGNCQPDGTYTVTVNSCAPGDAGCDDLVITVTAPRIPRASTSDSTGTVTEIDGPSACCVYGDIYDPGAALRAYIKHMQERGDAVYAPRDRGTLLGEDIKDPVVPLTIEDIAQGDKLLEERLRAQARQEAAINAIPVFVGVAEGLVALEASTGEEILVFEKGPTATDELAAEIRGNTPYSKQAIALLETEEGPTLVGGGERDLSAAQVQRALDRGLVPSALFEAHAEETVINGAGEFGLRPTNGYVTIDVCKARCGPFINEAGGAYQGKYFWFPPGL